MAERRMLAKSVIGSDAFCDMPLTSQALYMHLNVNADDDGFVNNPKKICRMLGASEDDLKILLMKQFLIPFESGVVVIKHWNRHNLLRKDRYKETVYEEERKLLTMNANKEYIWALNPIAEERLPIGLPTGNQMEPQGSIGKDRIEEISIVEDSSIVLFQLDDQTITEEQYKRLISKYKKELIDDVIKKIIDKPYHSCLDEKTIEEWVKERLTKKKKNAFHNFKERDYDFDQLEKMLICNYA